MSALAAHHEALRALFAERKTVAGVVARRLLGVSRPDDDELADHLIRERRRRSTLDGSIDRSLLLTAYALRELLDLQAPRDHAAVVRLSGYLLQHQNAPGRWGENEGEGAGFFSPGPSEAPVAPLVIHTGVLFDREADARFAVSCLALRQVIRAGHEERASVRAHLEVLLGLGPSALKPELAALALAALAMASPDIRERVTGWTEALIAADLPAAHLFEAMVPVPEAGARALVAEHLESLPPLPADADEDVALLYARAAATAALAR
jgi:hypothetical protein